MRPARKERVGGRGAEIAVRAAAWELARKGFGVTLHFPGGNPEEHLLLEFRSVELAKGLDLGCLVRDALNTLESMKVDFTVLEFSENIGAASAFKNDFDGVFVDAACFSALAPGESAVDPMTGMHNGDREACGGYASSATMQAFEGKRGAVSLTRAMTGASPSALREQEGPYASRLHADASGHERKDRIRPAQGLFTAGEAQEEASRCISCECMRCVKECAYLRQYGEYPKVYARQMFLNLGIYTGYRRLNSQINSCALCGQCDEICPERFSMADFCLLLREEMVRQRKMPPSAHHFALQEFSASAYEASVLALGGR